MSKFSEAAGLPTTSHETGTTAPPVPPAPPEPIVVEEIPPTPPVYENPLDDILLLLQRFHLWIQKYLLI